MKHLLILLFLIGCFYNKGIAQADPAITTASFSSSIVNQNSTVVYTLNFIAGGFDPIISSFTESGTTYPTFILQISFPLNKAIEPVDPTNSGTLITDSNNLFEWEYNSSTNKFVGIPKANIPRGTGTQLKVTLVGKIVTTQELQIIANIEIINALLLDDGNPGNNEILNKISVEESLPVTLTHFTAKKEHSTTALSWGTSDEIGSDRFEVQRSFDNKSWHNLGTVYAAGTSTTEREYDFVDASPLNGTNYYRLKMIDRDGSFELSRTVSVQFDQLASITVYPNPTAELVNIISREKLPIDKIVVQGASGESILTKTKNLNEAINLKPMPAGTYIIQIYHVDGQISTHKLIKL